MALAINNRNQQIVRDYTIKEKLGTGSYGVVYKVLKKGDKQFYVLKQISLFNMNKAQIDEVKNESKILASLNSIFIVKYYDSFIDNNNLNIIMEYCDGGDLSHLLNNQMKAGKMPSEDKIWKFFIQISLGIAYIHNKKILHRDLKTLNIFLTKDDKVKIGDLGVAKVLNQTNFARTFVGTPYYLSPEICEEKPYNEKSDVWALGCILYEMVTCKHPFNATNQGALILKILRGKYDPITNKDISCDLKKMVDILLEKSYFKRPAVTEIIKNPVFLNKAKSLNMIDMVFSTANDINLIIENFIYKDIQYVKDNSGSNSVSKQDESNSKRSSVQNSNENKKKSIECIAVKNVKIELNLNNNVNYVNNVNVSNQNAIPQNANCNAPSNEKKKIEDPSKKFIQMNLPNNFKKQLQNKKEISKQNNIVKQVINSNNNNALVNNMINAYNNFNNAEKVQPKENLRKVPVKIVKKEEVPAKKDSSSNFHNGVNISGANNNINNNNINNQVKERDKQKMKDLNSKLNDFDSRINQQIKVDSSNANSNSNSNNLVVANLVQKNLELNQMKRPITPGLINDKVKIFNPSQNNVKHKRPLSEKKESINPINEEKEECILDQMEKYYANKNLIAGLSSSSEKFLNLENQNIKKIENAPMVLPKNKYSKISDAEINTNNPGSASNIGNISNISNIQNKNMKITSAFLQDDKKCTNFFQDLLKADYSKLFSSGISDKINYDEIDINHFVNDLNKKSDLFGSQINSHGQIKEMLDNKVSLSDFMVDEKDMNSKIGINKGNINLEETKQDNFIQLSKLKNSNHNQSNISKISINLHSNEDNRNSKDTNHNRDTIPLYNNLKDNNLNFQVFHENKNEKKNINISTNLSHKDYSNIKTTVINSDSQITQTNRIMTDDSNGNNLSEAELCEQDEYYNEEDHSNDEEEVEAVENISIIKKIKDDVPEISNKLISSEEIKTEPIEEDKQQQEISELLEFREKFTKKIKFFKDLSIKTSGDKDFNKIFQYYMNISENQNESDETIEKIEQYIRELIPKNYFEFIQNFYNLVYYEIQLSNVEKELESRKIII